jgi:hypothetical protein
VNYFGTIKAALDAMLPGICRYYGIRPEDALAYVKAHLETMNNEWFSGERPNIAYQDPLCRFSYLFCHTAVNANLCEFALRQSPDIVQFLIEKMDRDQELRVCAFGGGPGTELLALSKYFVRTRPNGPVARLSFTLLDRTTEWSESWNALEGQINNELRMSGRHFGQWPFNISKTFIPHDMTHVSSYANMPNLFQQDLYLMNYVVSEIIGDHASFQAVVSTAAQSSPNGSKFIVIDRDQASVRTSASNLLRNAGLDVGEVHPTSTNMDADEQSSVLVEYIRAVGRQPRVQWGRNGRSGAFWIIGTKR